MKEPAARMGEPRKRVGLALGGGLVRGWAHIGVLSVLQEQGIPIDYVAGTSAGSIIGAAYCAGMDAERIHRYALTFRWRRITRLTWPRRGWLSFEKLEHWMVKELGELDFADLKVPLTVVATDIEHGQPVVLRQGPVARAVRASCSLPGAVAPVEWQGHWLCDGGLSDMVPVDVLREMGAEYVIGVDIFGFKIRSYLGPIGYLLAGLEILLERAGGGIDEADCLIAPELSGKTYLRFSRRFELYELGRRAALEKLPCIRAALGLVGAVQVQLEPGNTAI
ncbi:MAG: patatin-like phospholipase family protein [Chloroflexota bacterium]